MAAAFWGGGGSTEGQAALFSGSLITAVRSRPHPVRCGPARVWVETESPHTPHPSTRPTGSRARKPGQGGWGEQLTSPTLTSPEALLSRQALSLRSNQSIRVRGPEFRVLVPPGEQKVGLFLTVLHPLRGLWGEYTI